MKNNFKKSNIKILKAKMKDAEEMAKLELFCFDVKYIKIEVMALIGWQLAIDKQIVYKAVIDNKIIGGCVSSPTARRTWYMDSLFVNPKYRSLGVGSRLFKKSIAQAWISPIELMANIKKPYLVPFYESFGFKIKKKIYNYFNNGETHYIMMLE